MTEKRLVTNKDKKSRFNVVDLLIIIVVLLALSIFAYFIFLGGSAERGNEKTEIEYTIRIYNLRTELSDKVKEGDEVIDAQRFYSIGKVKSVRCEKSNAATGKIVNGKLDYKPSNDHVDMYITIRASAKKTQNGYTIGGYSLCTGKNVCIRTPGFTSGTGYCVGISEVVK